MNRLYIFCAFPYCFDKANWKNLRSTYTKAHSRFRSFVIPTNKVKTRLQPSIVIGSTP